MTEPGARRLLTGVGAITLVVEDLAAREFYDRVFGAPVVFEDESSFVVDLGRSWLISWRRLPRSSSSRPAPWAPRVGFRS